MNLQLGINNCFAVKRWPQPEIWAEMIREDFGLSIVQHSLDLSLFGLSESDLSISASRIQKACADHNLTVHSLFTGLTAYSSNLLLSDQEAEHAYWLDWYKKAVRYAGMIGAKMVGGHIGAFSVQSYADPEAKAKGLKRLIHDLAEIGQIGKDEGLDSILIEPMPVARELTSTISETEKLIAEINCNSPLPYTICLDTGHQCASGNSFYDRELSNWIRHFGNLVEVIHLQQNDGCVDSHLPFTAEHNKNGVVRPDKVIHGTRNLDSCVFIFEVIHPAEYPDHLVIEEIYQSIQHWKQHIS
jgi:sugar phosphate isomerase/epimerase